MKNVALLCAIVMLASCSTNKNDNPVPVAGITLSETTFSLDAGTAKKIWTNVTPKNATDTSVVWTSSDTAAVKVYSNGVVEGLGKGTSTVTAKTTDGGKIASCVVNVNPVMLATASSNASVSGNEGGAAFAIDGNMDTFWHSQWGPDAPLPHWLKVDLGADYNVSAIEFWRRGSTNNDIKTCDLQTSLDGASWTDIDTYSFSEATDKYRQHTFATPVVIRYVRLNITESNRSPFAGVAEIKVTRTAVN